MAIVLAWSAGMTLFEFLTASAVATVVVVGVKACENHQENQRMHEFKEHSKNASKQTHDKHTSSHSSRNGKKKGGPSEKSEGAMGYVKGKFAKKSNKK